MKQATAREEEVIAAEGKAKTKEKGVNDARTTGLVECKRRHISLIMRLKGKFEANMNRTDVRLMGYERCEAAGNALRAAALLPATQVRMVS
jgi:hypothetical protein